MYEAHFGLTHKPFSLLPDTRFVFMSMRHRRAAAALEYGVTNAGGLVVITGEIGCGKTTLVHHCLERFGQRLNLGVLDVMPGDSGNIQAWVNLAFDLPLATGEDGAVLFQAFRQHLKAEYEKGMNSVLFVDEAQNLSSEHLEQLRLLTNVNGGEKRLLQVILVGQPPLRQTLRQPALVQLLQRVSADFHLEPLAGSDIRDYVEHRLRVAGGKLSLFQNAALEHIARESRGIPRLINTLCDLSLVYAYAEEKSQVDFEIVTSVIADYSIQFPTPSTSTVA